MTTRTTALDEMEFICCAITMENDKSFALMMIASDKLLCIQRGC